MANYMRIQRSIRVNGEKVAETTKSITTGRNPSRRFRVQGGVAPLTTPDRSADGAAGPKNMRQDIKLSLFKLTVLQLLALLQNVIEKFTGNANFPTPPFSIAQMEAKYTELNDAVAAATEGGLLQRKLRDDLVLEVRDMLRVQASYVRTVANGNGTILASSGFALRRQPEPIEVVDIPQNVKAKSTYEEGALKVTWSRTLGARMFRLERAEGDPTLPTTTWSVVTQTSRQSVEVKNLVPYQAYYFRVVALGIDAEGKPSDVVLGRAA